MVLQVDPGQYPALLSHFPDSPENVHVRYFLSKNLCEVYLAGSISNPQAIIVKSKPQFELFGYYDPNGIFEILQSLEKWSSILVNNDVSDKLGRLLSPSQNIKYEKEIYFVLTHPVTTQPTNNSRLLTIKDLPLLQNTGVFDDYQKMLTDGIVVGIIIDNQLASIAYATHITEKFADLGIFTAPDYRNKGYSTSAAAFLIKELQAKNLIPVWSTDENNLASLKVAKKLGFTQTSTKTYVNLTGKDYAR